MLKIWKALKRLPYDGRERTNGSLQLHRIHTLYQFTRDKHPLVCIVFSLDYKVKNTVYQNVIIYTMSNNHIHDVKREQEWLEVIKIFKVYRCQ